MIIEVLVLSREISLDFIMRVVSFLFAVALGVGGKLAFRAKTHNIKKREIITSIFMALLIGYWVDQIATEYGFIRLRGVCVSASALVSESIVQYWFSNDNSIIKDIMNVILRKNGNGKSDNSDI